MRSLREMAKMGATCIFIGSFNYSQKNRKGPFELIYVITYRDLCRLISPPHRPDMDCYKGGCHTPTFAMKVFKSLYNSLCLGMSNYVGEENGQNGCYMHFYSFVQEFHENRKRPWINNGYNLSLSMSFDIAPK